jgi:hypothetical protein
MKIGGSRKLLAMFLALGSILTLGVPSQAKDAWRPLDPSFFNPKFSGFSVDYNNGRDIVLIEEEGERTYDAVYHITNTEPRVFNVCEDPGKDLNCGQSTSGYVTGRVVLPLCGTVVENCIEGLSVGTSTSMTAATYQGSGYGFPFVGDAARGIPRGSGPSYFDSSVAHSNGNRYAVVAIMRFGIDSGRANVQDFSVRVFPVIERPSSQRLPFATVCDTNDGKGLGVCIQHVDECVYQLEGVCASGQEFAPDTRFGVSLKLSNSVSGWFRGRLKDPVIDVKPINAEYSRVEVSGEPVVVPRLVTSYVTGQDGPDILGRPQDNSHGGPFTIFNSASSRAVEIVNKLRTVTKDVATAVNTNWMINSIPASAAAGQAAGCFSDTSRLLGVVTTNAMAYTGTVPDYKDGYLSYRVAGMHFLPDGVTEAIGTYDLVMRSDVARCVYGFSKAPVSATIQVVGSGGEEKVATTIVGERNGWLKLAAYGFTFSEKEIRVSLSQKAVPVPQTLNLAKFSGTSTKLSSPQRWAIEDFVFASTLTKTVTCTATFVKSADKARALARANAACAAAKALKRNYVVKSVATQTKTKSLDGRVVLQSR